MIKNILVVFLLLISGIVLGQRTSSSPYSYFGFGEEFNPVTVEQASMGGIGVAFNSPQYLNFTNPAAYANLRYATYSFGLLSKELTVKTNGASQTVNNTSLNYYALAFPIGKKAGFSIGMQPLSAVGYSLINIDNSEEDAEGLAFKGNGGVNRLYGSFGIKVFKELSLGVEADFSFGTLENSVTYQKENVSLATKYKQESIIRGGALKFGAQYAQSIKKDLILNTGLTFKLGSNLNVEGTENLYTLKLSGTGTETIKKTDDEVLVNGTYKMPTQTIFGLGVGKFNKWYAGVEYENAQAIATDGFSNRATTAYRFDTSNRISVGGFYTPKASSISSYWDRVTYRAGVRVENTGLLIDGAGSGANFSEVKDFGMTFGLSLPLGRKLSNLNLGFEYGKKGTTSNGLIQENYFNVRAGLSLNAFGRQAWFQKRKID